MDGLALLCNLHADGPTTLHHLRAGGCGTLLEVAMTKPTDLETLLGWNSKAARRFQREARILAARLENGQTDGAWMRAFADDPRTSPLPPEGCRSADREDALAWERADEVARGGGESRPAVEDIAPPVADPVGPPDDGGQTLQSLVEAPDCESLTLDIVDKLAKAGIRTLTDLVDGDVLEISSLIGIGYTRLARIRFLVRRHIDAQEAEAGSGIEVIPALPPATVDAPGASETPGDRLGASGPFA